MITPEILIQISLSTALFFVLWMFLGKVWFKPYLELLIDREKQTVGATKEAVQKLDENRRILDRIESELRTTRIEGINLREELTQAAKSEAQKILDQAKSKADLAIENARKDIINARQAAIKELAKETEEISAAMIKQVLGESSARLIH
jgi:F0F1-type ATP synthase membrane subunit b/b'